MAIKKRPVSPRQKMINLMYVVLMAMLALNVSPEVLDGFAIVGEGLRRSTASASQENRAVYDAFERQMKANPVKTRKWYDRAQEIRSLSDSICQFAETLKQCIAREADGDPSDADSIRNMDDQEATAQVMLAPGKGMGEELWLAINNYRERIAGMIQDPARRRVIEQSLSTDVPASSGRKHWKDYMFESMPAIAAVTMLTKLQSDVRYAEGEALHSLMANIDEKDVRVNQLDAFVIPESRTVVRGSSFRAGIVMAAVDTTQIPTIFIGGKKEELKNGIYDIPCNATGSFTLKGYLEATGKDGSLIRREFSQPYSVVEPTATVSADLMNILYAGYDNPVSVSVPGIPLSEVKATMTGGTLTQKAPGRYVAKPAKAGQDAVITVFSTQEGKSRQMAQYAFRVRKLPEPAPYISLTDEKGARDLFKGGPLAKARLLSADRIGAAVDDGILHIPFRVLSFECVLFDNMGNAVPVTSDGAVFSDQQKSQIRRLARGKRLYVSRVRAIGPDGIERRLNTSMEIIIR